LSDQTAGAVARICRRLDGIPLAIELVAARVGALTVEQIADRLDAHFVVPGAGRRTALPRHRTLTGAIDWSYDLLSEAERMLLRRLSVFEGGWTLASAEAVCADARSASQEHATSEERRGAAPAAVAPADVVELLLHLVDKSLVQRDADARAEPRYRLLEMLREYGLQKLSELDELREVRRRHREHFVAFAEAAEPGMFGQGQAENLARVEREHDNLRAVLGRCLTDPTSDGLADDAYSQDSRQADAEAGVQLAGALWRFWHLYGHIGEGRRWLVRAVAMPPAAAGESAPSHRARAYLGLSYLSQYEADYQSAATAAESALAIWQEAGDARGESLALNRLGLYVFYLGDYDRAVRLCDESVALGRELRDDAVLAMGLLMSAVVRQMLGEWDRSLPFCDEHLALRRRIGPASAIGYGLRALAHAVGYLGDFDRAAELIADGMTISREVGDRRGVALSHADLGYVAGLSADTERAISLLLVAISAFEELGDPWEIVRCLYFLASALTVQGTQDPAVTDGSATSKPWALGTIETLRGATRVGAAGRQLHEAIGIADVPEMRAIYERNEALLRRALGDATFSQVEAEGRAMSMEKTIAYVRAILQVPNTTTDTRRPATEGQQFHPLPHVEVGSLSHREREIAGLVGTGRTNRQIADDLALSSRTVETHVHNILGKLGLSSRAQIVIWAIEHGLAVTRPT
jgi:non-specific serine/threonine protein kinase